MVIERVQPPRISERKPPRNGGAGSGAYNPRHSLCQSINRAIELEEEHGEGDGHIAEKRPANYRDMLIAQRNLGQPSRRWFDPEMGGGTTVVLEEVEEENDDDDNPLNNDSNEVREDESNVREQEKETARNRLRTMSIVVGRRMDGGLQHSNTAGYESMILSLQQKMKKMDADGEFEKNQGHGLPWYAPPVQRQSWNDDKMLPILDYGTLFFDLFFVGAIYNIGEMIISAAADNPSTWWFRAAIYFVGIFGPIFVTWETDVYYHSRYCVADYAHRLYDVIRFVSITMAVLAIQPIQDLADPQNSPSTFLLTVAIVMESALHCCLNIELYYFGQGDRIAIKNHTLRKIQKQLVPTFLTYLSSTLIAGILYFGSFKPLNTGTLWSITDLPLSLTALGYLSNVFYTFVRKLRATRGSADIRTTFVPNNIDFLIQRYADWFLLLLGEVVMAMMELTDSKRNYVVAAFGSLTTIILHLLKFESEPSKPHGHALWRNFNNATCFSLLIQAVSMGLILLSVSYKILVTEGSFGISESLSTYGVCVSLAWVVFTLELIVLTHKGIKRSWQRLFRRDPSGTESLHWPLLSITLIKIGLVAVLLSMPAWVPNPETAVVLGFPIVACIALTRIVGWAFVFHEDDIRDFVGKATRKLQSKVSFAVDAWRGSTHGSAKSDKETIPSRDLDRGHETSSIGSGGSWQSRRKREEVYDDMFDAVVLTDLKGFIVTANQTTLDVFGFSSREELVGQNVSILVGGGDAKHHDAYLARFHQNDKDKSQIGKQRVLHAKRKDGSEFPCIVGIKKSSNGKYLIGYIRDMTAISDLEMPQAILADPSSHINNDYKCMSRLLDDKSSECIVIIDYYGIIRGVNSTIVASFGYIEKADLIGEKISVLMNHQFASKHDEYLAKFREKDEHSVKVSHVLGTERVLLAKRKDGTEFKCIIGVHGIENTELLVGYIRNVDVPAEPNSKSVASWRNAGGLVPAKSSSCRPDATK